MRDFLEPATHCAALFFLTHWPTKFWNIQGYFPKSLCLFICLIRGLAIFRSRPTFVLGLAPIITEARKNAWFSRASYSLCCSVFSNTLTEKKWLKVCFKYQFFYCSPIFLIFDKHVCIFSWYLDNLYFSSEKMKYFALLRSFGFLRTYLPFKSNLRILILFSYLVL